jgi:Ca2+-binding EF-hand superfamily protein
MTAVGGGGNRNGSGGKSLNPNSLHAKRQKAFALGHPLDRASSYQPNLSPRKPEDRSRQRTLTTYGGRHSRLRGPRPSLGDTNVQTTREKKEIQMAHRRAVQSHEQQRMVAEVNEATRQKVIARNPQHASRYPSAAQQQSIMGRPGGPAAAAGSPQHFSPQVNVITGKPVEGVHLPPRARAADRWYSRRNPNALQGDRSSYLRPNEVGSLRLTIHAPEGRHSQSPIKRAADLAYQQEMQQEALRREAYREQMESQQLGATGDRSLVELRLDAQKKLRHKRAHELLHKLRQRLSQHPSLARVFKTWDTDNSGTLTLPEMQQALGMLNIKSDDHAIAIQALFGLFDDDGSGEIEAKEFIDAIRHGDTFLPEHKRGQAVHDKKAADAAKAAQGACLTHRTPIPHHKHKRGHKREDDEVDAVRLTHAMRYLRDRFRHAKRSKLIKLLQQYDADGDGCIDSDELRNVFLMMNIPLTPAETTILIETQFDKDGDGAVDYGEFIDRLKESNDADWEQLFDVFETEFKRQKLRAVEERKLQEELMRKQKQGFRLKTRRERVEMSPALRNVVLANMGSILHGFERFDVDGDGVLDREEFGCMLEHFGQRKGELKLTKQDVDMIFHYFDKDGDGELDKKEITSTMFQLGHDARASGGSSQHGSHAMHAALEANNFHDLPTDDEEVMKQRFQEREIAELAAKKSYRRFGSDTRVSIYDSNAPPGGTILPSSGGTFGHSLALNNSNSMNDDTNGAGLPGHSIMDPAIRNYKKRQTFLKGWMPDHDQVEKIRLAVQFSAENEPGGDVPAAGRPSALQ